MIAVIMAGGKGTRIAPIAGSVPKPMVKLNGKPVLEYQIDCLRNYGIDEVIITVSYKKEAIIEYFGDGSAISPITGKPFGLKIGYYEESRPLGNAGALFKIRDRLKEDFLLINADTIFDIDFSRFFGFHKSKHALVTLLTHPNSHPYDSALIVSDENYRVKEWFSKEDDLPCYYKNRVNAGIHIINPTLIYETEKRLMEEQIDLPLKIDLDRDVLKPAIGKGGVFCYDTSEYVRDMGTPERYESVCSDIRLDIVSERNLRRKQRAVFFDRDGTINKYVGFVRKTEEFELLPGVTEAIKQINKSGYLAIVVTNQPVIARGEITEAELSEIHNKMETLIGEEGAYIDRIYYCPHHPDSGFKGEKKELKIECSCRKPKPGMIYKAMIDYNIDLSKSWMIGDEERDVLAGKSAGCQTILIGETDYGQDYSAPSIKSAVELLMNLEL